ncbi:MAG: S8 family serine peptidase, partial [Candidatus Thermoplasmatota archaeon]
MRINSLVLSLFIVSVLIFQYSSFSEDEKIVRMELKLKIGTFDPLYDNEPVPKELRMEKSSYYIVQFKDRIEKDWRFEVEKVARIYRYLPENSYIIKTDNIGYLEKLPFIRWIGLYHPGYKISPQIKNFLKDTYFVTLFDDDWLKVETDKIKEIAFIEGVEWIEKYPEPKLLNDIAARTIDVRQATDGAYSGTSALWSYNPTSDKFEGYPGNNITVAVMDTGVDATHPTFEGRIKKIITYGYGTAGEDGWVGHGTHVSGSVLGNGTWRSADPSGQKGKYAGMAPNAELVMQHLWGWPSPNKATSDAVANGASISSNSWGVQTSPYGSYDSTAQGYDSAVRLPLTVIFAAGNSGSSADTITPPATGKNVITIGATGNDKGGYSSNVVQSFSSRGPTDDGRIKPDLVAPGILIASARSAQRTTNPGYGNPSDDSDGSSYVYMGGTSMSCPIVAGSAAVVIDYYKTVYGITPSPALVKALLINGADPIPGYTYPGNAQGWGMVNIVKSVIQKGSYKIFDDDQKTLLNKDDTSVYTANVLSSEPLKISLVWTDKPASVNANPALVNDLDLIVTSPNGDTYYGNVFSNGESVKGGKADSINNVEGFYLKAPQIGNWTITVTGKNVPLGPQDYAIVISGPILVGRDYIDLSPIEIKFSKTNPVEGEKIGLSLKIKNSGTILANNVGYEMLDTKPDKTTISILKGTITSIGAGEERVIEFQWVAAPRGIHKFKLKVDQLKLIPESIEDNNELTSYITVGYYGLTVYPSVATKNLDPGNSTKYVIAIKNCGTVVDTYNLSFESVPIGWSADVSQKSVTLSSGATANVDITVKAPINALAGEKAKIKLICVSKGNSSYSAEVLTYTTVNQVYGLEIFADKLSVEILPGESAIYNITLRNLGNGNDTFDFNTRKADTELDWIVKTNMRSADLPPKSEINVSMEVTAPKKIVANEAIDVDFLARSSSNIERELKTKTTIGKTYSISISGEGRAAVEPGASFIYNITILNGGNYEEEVSFKLELPEGWESSELEPIIVQPYNQTKIEVYIETKDIELAGNYNITLYAISKKTHQFIFNVEVKQYYRLELLFKPKKI